MALIYSAQLNPSKIELLRAWVPEQSWLGSTDASSLEPIGAYRFDDPAGEVGIETHLLRTTDGTVLQVPLTYRGAPLVGADAFLIRTMEHSVLGERWVYDACSDPVYVRALATTIISGGSEAPLEFANPDDAREVTTHVFGSGAAGSVVPEIGVATCSTVVGATVIAAGAVELTVVRVVDLTRTSGDFALTGTWPGQADPALLVSMRIG
ncbi:hypothetical protein [Rhodococcus sp. IEGM 1379]|uniref:CG0192-related protein n=1 Tax=Rhodococcus sp. IEGM 1379 TaxID=3047086 RepID=UPI0024B7311F|nr:hypothetical protein [Rhodococcus sp. IEGM 1379]MDI9918076.1 hypothetical protein [Rhodococcus sp. IEGM 1379]